MARLEGKVALVTGAARGQGRAEALRFSAEGAAIIAVDICRSIDGVEIPGATPEDLEETMRLVRAQGGRISAHVADVRDLNEMTAAVDSGVAEFGRLDIVMANAGITTFARFDALTEEDFQLNLDVNLIGVWKSIRAALPHLRASTNASVIVTSSLSGLTGPLNQTAYAAAKHGAIGLMKVLSNELGPEGIRVNAICPASTSSPMLLNDTIYRLFRPDLESPGRDDISDIALRLNSLPVPWVEPDDIANAALFLASDEARYITGLAMQVDAGALTKVNF